MVKVISGGQEFYLDQNLKTNLDEVKKVVSTLNWDYVSIVAGNPGTGKSQFAQTIAKYVDPKFDRKNIAFSGEDFVDITNRVPKQSAVVLDESFQTMNTKVSMSPAFLPVNYGSFREPPPKVWSGCVIVEKLLPSNIK